MKKFYILLIAVAISLPSAFAQYREGYYNAMNGKKKEDLKEAVKECVIQHTMLEYYGLPNNWRYTDVYPELYNGNVRWWEMYSNSIYLIKDGQSPTSSFSSNKMQREHSVPKSWWGSSQTTPAYTDLFNLLPSDGECNMAKSNYPYGDVMEGRATFDNGSAKVGTPAAGQGGGAAKVFEPADEYKGDFARGIFYMACVYDDLRWTSSYSYNMFQQNSWPTLKTWAYETLLEWHRADPVSQKEIDRNNAVETQQGNRNPFIDFPNLAEYIWGRQTSETFYIADQGNAQTPYPSDGSYITQPVNNEALDFGECAVNGVETVYLEIKGMIDQPLSISISGTDRAMFTLGQTSVLPSQLNFSKTALVPVAFNPTSEGEKKAILLIYDGGLNGSIRVELIGRGTGVPVLSRLTAYEATEVTEESYVANWSVAPEVVDYYIVDRTIYGAEGTETEMLESNTNSLKIMRSENVMESYTVRSSRLGFISEASNAITVAKGAGLFSLDATSPIGVETDADGFTLIGGAESVDIAVYDIGGRLVYLNASAARGSHVGLPSGIYLLHSSFLNRPIKVLIP